jgi:hypothetical protein
MKNKDKFVNEILYSNSKIIADDSLYQDVASFIENQGEEYFDESTMTEIYGAWDYFCER